MTQPYQEGYAAGQKLCSLGVSTPNPHKVHSDDWDEWNGGYNDACSDYENYQSYGGFV